MRSEIEHFNELTPGIKFKKTGFNFGHLLFKNKNTANLCSYGYINVHIYSLVKDQKVELR